MREYNYRAEHHLRRTRITLWYQPWERQEERWKPHDLAKHIHVRRSDGSTDVAFWAISSGPGGQECDVSSDIDERSIRHSKACVYALAALAEFCV